MDIEGHFHWMCYYTLTIFSLSILKTSFHCLIYCFSLSFSNLIMKCLCAFCFLLLLFKYCLRFANLGSWILKKIWKIFILCRFLTFSGTPMTCVTELPQRSLTLCSAFSLFNLFWVCSMDLSLSSQILSYAMSVCYKLIHWILHLRYYILSTEFLFDCFKTSNSAIKFPICSLILSVFFSKFLNIYHNYFLKSLVANSTRRVSCGSASIDIFLLIIGQFPDSSHDFNFYMLEIF